MKLNTIFLSILLMLLAVCSINAQESKDSLIIGTWQGTIKIGTSEIPLFVKIAKNDKGQLSGTLDSPSQNATNIPIDVSIYNKDSITFTAGTIGSVYKAAAVKDSLKLEGIWIQGGKSTPLSFSKVFETNTVKDVKITPPLPNQDSLLYGNWQGNIDNNGATLPLVIKFSKNRAGVLIAFLDSPQQGAKDIPTTKVLFEGDSVKIIANNISAMFQGKLIKDSSIIKGIWYQIGKMFPLNLSKTDKPLTINRPQEPKGPYPYNEEQVSFKNKKANINLAGTLTTPKTGSKFPVVVMITGSGPQDRDENIFNHKPFKVIADYLTRLGIAVLRFDDRGTGSSEGDFSKATTQDFAGDVTAAVDYLKSRKDINKKKIGLIGHSEGGIIAPICAVNSKNISFIVLLAGTGVKGDELLLEQTRLVSLAYGMDTATINRSLDLAKKIYPELQKEQDNKILTKTLEQLYTQYWNSLPESLKTEQPLPTLIRQSQALTSPWFKYFVGYDPSKMLRKVKIPVLVLNGSNDLQVPPKQNLPAIEKALKQAGNKDYKIVEIPGLNHLFQHSKTGSTGEYASIEETFAPEALKILGDWILEKTAK